jgi:hypothetical protein
VLEPVSRRRRRIVEGFEMVWNPPKRVVYLSAAATCVGLACLVK